MLSSFSDFFALNLSKLGRTSLIQHSIDTGGQGPVEQLPYHTSFPWHGIVEEMVNQMLEQEVIKPSSSPWANSVVFVVKNEGTSQFCVDYHRLNLFTKTDTFPLPHIDD